MDFSVTDMVVIVTIAIHFAKMTYDQKIMISLLREIIQLIKETNEDHERFSGLLTKIEDRTRK